MNTWMELFSKPAQDAWLTALFLDAAIKSLVVLALATGTCALWRRASAATRHLIWFLALACLVCLPLLTAALPSKQKEFWSGSTGYDSANQISLGLDIVPAKRVEAAASQLQISPQIAGQSNLAKKPSASDRKLTA